MSSNVRVTNIEARSRIHCCSVETIIVTYSESVFVALSIQQTKSRNHIVISGLSGCTVFFSHYLMHGTFFETKILNAECVFLIVYIHFVKHFSF